MTVTGDRESGRMRSVRWVVLTVLTVAAVATGLAGSFVHRAARPGGIVLALAAAVGLMLLTRAVARTRVGLGVVAAACLAPVAVLAVGTSAGDVVLAADPVGLTYLLGVVGVMSVVVGLGVPISRTGAGAAVPRRGTVPDRGPVS